MMIVMMSSIVGRAVLVVVIALPNLPPALFTPAPARIASPNSNKLAGCARCTAVGCTTTDTKGYGRTNEQFRI